MLRGKGSYNGHLCVRAALYEGPGQQVFKMSSRSTVATSTTRAEGYNILKDALRACVRSMPYGLGENICNSDVYDVMNCAEIKTLMSQLETESAGAIDDHTVREVQRHLDGLVISEIDKARGELCIM